MSVIGPASPSSLFSPMLPLLPPLPLTVEQPPLPVRSKLVPPSPPAVMIGA